MEIQTEAAKPQTFWSRIKNLEDSHLTFSKFVAKLQNQNNVVYHRINIYFFNRIEFGFGKDCHTLWLIEFQQKCQENSSGKSSLFNKWC